MLDLSSSTVWPVLNETRIYYWLYSTAKSSRVIVESSQTCRLQIRDEVESWPRIRIRVRVSHHFLVSQYNTNILVSMTINVMLNTTLIFIFVILICQRADLQEPFAMWITIVGNYWKNDCSNSSPTVEAAGLRRMSVLVLPEEDKEMWLDRCVGRVWTSWPTQSMFYTFSVPFFLPELNFFSTRTTAQPFCFHRSDLSFLALISQLTRVSRELCVSARTSALARTHERARTHSLTPAPTPTHRHTDRQTDKQDPRQESSNFNLFHRQRCRAWKKKRHPV